jgi:hypothetical protein
MRLAQKIHGIDRRAIRDIEQMTYETPEKTLRDA